MDRSCIMFNCLWQLWDWLDPPVLTSSVSMEDKKMAPPPQQHQSRPILSYVQHAQQPIHQGENKYPQNVQYLPSPTNSQQMQQNIPNGVIHQAAPRPYVQSIGPRSPLLENHQELYGTKQPNELSRQYALREHMQMIAQRNDQHQQRSIPMTDSSYSLASPTHDPILSAPVPPGFNASVHQAYLRRNQHQLEHNQIYQNHQNIYQSTNQQPRVYQPYTSRIQQSNYLAPGHSHTQLLRQQYNELQQMKIQQQIQYQNQAQLQQQQTFAQRQILHQHLHSRQQSQQNLSQYDSTHNINQKDLQNMDANLKVMNKNDRNVYSEDYAYDSNASKSPLSLQKQPLQSPTGVSPSNKNIMDNGSSPSSKSPSGSESRRSSYGTTQALRSPIAQRPLAAPVTMAGWLYKQGSDGLKVWRKRWFVLTEYCLFYYKGQEEDKLLGSVLLPSYQVSICEPDDKVLRKFAFKCEHTNMRTYILAAPDREQMSRWMKALTMATLMQEGGTKTKLTQPREQQQQQQQQHQQQQQQQQQPQQPATNMEQNIKNPNNNTNDRDEISQDECGGIQPMYENAPPKPRRSNEGYNSPSPDRSIDRYDPNYDLLRDSSAVNKEQKPIANRVNSKSPYSAEKIYDSKSSTYASNYTIQSQLSKSPDPTYNSHNLSLPLTNTATHRLENNQSQYGYLGNSDSKMSKDKLEERLNQNKTPVYKDQYNDSIQPYYSKDEHKKYGETNYQKMVDRQDYNSDIRDHYIPEQGQGHEYQQHTPNMGIANDRQAFERRTPDTYGRSVIVPGYYSKGRAGDYEDIYNTSPSINNQNQNYGEVAYRRPVSPVTYDDKKSLQNNHQLYVTSNVDKNQSPIVSQSRHKKIPHNYSAPMPPYNTVPRPHSADFLEYEAKNPVMDPNQRNPHSNHSRQPPRPKSSLDINSYDYNPDNYHYSEASYAEKMRQSAHYLRNKAAAASVVNVKHANLKPPDYISQRKMSAPTFHTNNSMMDNSYESDIRINNESMYRNNDPNKNEDAKYLANEISGPNSNWTLRNKSLSNIIGQDDIYLRSNSAMSEESVSASCGYNKNMMIDSNSDQFIRSASARLPTAGDQPSREGERKVQQREESMKRLLEWKQRMLQSPLTRKSTPATLSLARSLNQTKAHQNQQSSDRYLNSSGSQRFSKSTSRIPSHHQSTYNSYSSDDEERLADIVGGEPSTSTRQGQAGRSPTPPPLPTPTVLSNAIHPYDSASDTALMHRPPHDLPPLNQSPHVKSALSEESEMTSHTSKEEIKSPRDNKSFPDIGDSIATNEDINETSELQCEYTDEDLDEVLALYDDEDIATPESNAKNNESNNSSNQKENINFKNAEPKVEPFSDYEICEINQPETNENNSPKNNNNSVSPLYTPNPDVCENHYLPMSPRKHFPSPQTIQENIFKNIHPFNIDLHEDNSYVEMSHGIGIESAFINEETQAYEVVCVPGNKTEPVYMELNNLPEKNIFSEKSNSDNNINTFEASTPILNKDTKNTSKSSLRANVKSPLPDILLESQKKSCAPKSDSSDADDELSKDFSMEKAYSRFSLSDNFRPASYYLRSKSMRSDFQDSSDSDIIPPPPIPTSLPPMDELEIGSNLSLQLKYEDRSILSETDVNERNIEKKSTSLMVYGNTPSMYDTIFKGERVKRNRVSLPDGDKLFLHAKSCESLKNTSLDSKSIPPTYKMSGNTDTDSLLSYNADRGSSRMSIDSDMSSKFDISTTGGSLQLNERQSINIPSNMNINDEDDFVELRHSHTPSDAEIERMMKRRPLSEESCYDIESFDGTMNDESDPVNLDDYLKDLKFGSMVLSRDNMYQHSKIFNSEPNLQEHFLQKCTTGYLNERVAAIREEAQYENINLGERAAERCRSRNSNMSNSTSDPETVNTFQTVYSLGEVTNSEIGGSTLNMKFDSNTPIRSVSRNSLPTSSASSLNLYTQYPANHTRHSSFEQPTISYYSKNTSPSDKDTSILKNLNYHENCDASKVNVMEMSANKAPKSVEELIHLQNPVKLSNISHSRENSAEQSAPYYYSDLSSQDNLNITSLATPSLSIFNKNNIITSNKLNNQRRKGPVGRKSDISHIHNPIHSNLSNNENIGQEEESNLIAAAARCVSMEFLSVTDKVADIDDKNIYESSALKNEKLSTSLLHVNSHIGSKNLYPQVHDKTSPENAAAALANYDRNSLRGQIVFPSYPNHGLGNNSYNSRTSLNNSTISEEGSQILLREIMNSNNLNDISPNSRRISNNMQENSTSEINNSYGSRNAEEQADKTNYDGEMMWDEDALWRENLRRVSHRHARSLDHLDCLSTSVNISGRRSVDLKTMLISSENVCNTMTMDSRHRSTRLTRDVTYVNDNVKSQRTTTSKRKHKKHKSSKMMVSKPPDLNNENDVYVQLVLNANKDKGFHNTDDGVYEQLMVEAKSNGSNLEENSINTDQYFPSDEDGKNDVKKKFEIDREKLRQWDLMSSGLLKNESSPCAGSVTGGGAAEGGGMYTTTATSASLSLTGNDSISRSTNHLNTSKKAFSGSNPTLSRGNPRDTIPVRAVSPRVRSSSAQPWNSQIQDYDTWSNQNLSQIATEDNWSTMRSPSRQSNQPVRAVSPRVRRASEVEEMQNTVVSISPSGYDPLSGIKNLSAGELLGRTHEELVLLLIQLRRKHTATANAIEQCFSQIQSVQNRINAVEFLEQKHENLQRLEQLKHHLMELEKHYEKSKPLVHLVDNMVKLGTLYNRGPGGSVPTTLDRLEYNQMVRERALMEQAAEQRRWAESAENLPRDHVEKRVEELRALERWVAGEANTLRGLRQERDVLAGPALQHDLSRVHAMLAENSKKLEQTVAGNARLEQELMVLRQKLQQQQSINARSNGGSSMNGESGIDTRAAADATALLEDELKRVQQLVGDLQKQRQELSFAVRQLTDKSQNLGLISPSTSTKLPHDYTTGTKDATSKGRHNSVWIETDLDNSTFIEHGSNALSSYSLSSEKKLTPLFIDTHSSNNSYGMENKDNTLSPNLNDDMGLNSTLANLSNVEKQEIKTVRIVKRESERRQRDRERSLQPGSNDWTNQQTANMLDQLAEEENNLSLYQNKSASLPRTYPAGQLQHTYGSNQIQDSQMNGKSYVYHDYNQYRPQINPPTTLSLSNVNIPYDNTINLNPNLGNKNVSSSSLNNNDYYNNHQDTSAYTNHSKYAYNGQITSNYQTSQQNKSQLYLESPVETSRQIMNGPISPEVSKNGSVNSLTKGNAELSPIFTSEAARQIIIEMAGEKNGFVKHSNGSQHRRQVPKEKRRHYTAPHHIIAKSFEKSPDDDIFCQEKWWRARDDVDMERVLRGGALGNKHGPPPLVAPPDVVRSTLPAGPMPDHYSEHTIDRLLAAPNKIVIPERYVPEQAPELSPEEQKKRREKVESIKKMLTSTTTPSSDPNKSPDSEDKRQREHLLQLNQLLAKQVMEKSKIVAAKALEKLPIDNDTNYDSEDLSPEIELPLYQQRDNFFT